MKSRRNKSVFFTLIIVIVICFCTFFINLADFLIINETPRQSDVIVVLSGEAGRLQKAVNLYEEGFGNYLLLTNSKAKFSSTKEAMVFGIPKNKILEEEKATSTYTNAIYAKEIIKKNKFKSAIIVSSDFHMRRTKMTFDRIYKDTGIQLFYVSSSTPWFYKDQWWVDKVTRRLVLNEWVRVVGYKVHLYKWIDW